jgi:hypothetical protein
VTPEQEEQVRRALAAAVGRQDPDSPASPESMPPEVAARLDGVLAELAATRRAGSDPVDAPGTATRAGDDGVADPARAHRRRWPRVLVAAAALAVVALGGTAVVTGALIPTGSGDATSAGSASSETRDDTGGQQKPAPSAGAGLAAPRTAGGDTSAAAPVLRSAHLQGDVGRLLRGGVAAFAAPQREGASASPPSPTGARAPAAGCARPATAAGDRLVAVRLDGRRATLLLRPAGGGTQEAQVYSCGDPVTPVATTTVPAR